MAERDRAFEACLKALSAACEAQEQRAAEIRKLTGSTGGYETLVLHYEGNADPASSWWYLGTGATRHKISVEGASATDPRDGDYQAFCQVLGARGWRLVNTDSDRKDSLPLRNSNGLYFEREVS